MQVLIFATSSRGCELLLLRRIASLGGFWQSVTGSLEERESHREAAIREVSEETGIKARSEDLIDLRLVNTFEIAPQWRSRYAAGVTHNEEVCFALRVEKHDVQLDRSEHDAWAWVDSDTALEMLHWISNKRALTRLLEIPRS